ncbi:DUF4129 domain-containing protein [Halosegnis rubeus]|jgi:hypothetical protein|uniref:DUF4129 domain-containing protein n=1 Tax=Halosegnis rubeus TaxID=2212850 RepID=A0A5N5ULX7_9EURY|nr:DUF4129 domain-containing protein [Halosegnis rubeus]KAB7515841.1 DUF4129 domain-containing protein [Halosegnis rubeus]KAB7516945.1 DUF4129 domain-containing protein [Halosegnis rubeus]KAB7519927.1 DUF4129 domain-containing protein [Halosegnis rubeus]
MNRQRVVALLAVGVLVVGLGVAAGALDSLERERGGEGVGTEAGGGVERQDGQLRTDPQTTTDTIASIPPVVKQVLAVLVAVLLVVSTVDILRRHGPKAVAAVVGTFVLVALVLQTMEEGNVTPGEGGNRTNVSVGGDAGGVVSTGETVSQATEPPVILGGIIAFLALGGALLFLLSGRSSKTTTPEPEQPALDADAETVAQTAAEAADRVAAGVDVDNEIYRAWEEMTAALDIDRPESATPSEFADAAVEAGFDREDVAELTRLFEETRYGEYPVTDDRTDRAERALRSVERGGAE